MNHVPSLGVATLAVALGVAGCSSPATRVGEIHLGDTRGVVQSAMGNPDEKQYVANARGDQTIWIYKHYLKEGRQSTGWSEVMVPAVHDQHDTVVQTEVTHDVYGTQVNEDVRVTFTGGVVSAIEHLKG